MKKVQRPTLNNNCNYNERCLQQRKISDVATKPTIFELKPLEPKKICMIFFIFQVPLETRMNSTCTSNYNESCLHQKQMRDVKLTIFEQTPTDRKKKIL